MARNHLRIEERTMAGATFYVPVDVAQTPKTGDCICDHWWSVHPEHGLIFWFHPFGYTASEEPAPQCNQDEHTAKRLSERLYPGSGVRQMPVVFMAHAMVAMRKERARLQALRKSAA
jgi:hypothetical protein